MDASNNGAIESPHGHLKREITDALGLRGTRDFADLDATRSVIADLIGRINARHDKAITAEVQHLQVLPARRSEESEDVSVRVTATRGVTRRRVFTSVPTRLMGHQRSARVHADHIALTLGTDPCLTVPRKPHQADQGTVHVIHDRPVIGALKTKPGALLNRVDRDNLCPRADVPTVFRKGRRRSRPARRMSIDGETPRQGP